MSTTYVIVLWKSIQFNSIQCIHGQLSESRYEHKYSEKIKNT